MTEIPAELVEAQRELMRAERDVGRHVPGADERLARAQREEWKAWESFHAGVRRQVRELALPLDEEEPATTNPYQRRGGA